MPTSLRQTSQDSLAEHHHYKRNPPQAVEAVVPAVSRPYRQPLLDTRRWLRGLFVVVLYTLGTMYFTWPLAVQLTTHTVGHIDPPFSIWRLAWVARHVLHQPTQLFDANIFWPAHRTLAYSDAIVLQGALAAPLVSLGWSPLTVMNFFTLVGFAASGVAAYVLARRLTGHTGAALLAGAVFAFAPCRLDHTQHLELQWGFWMPLAFWAWHRSLDRGRFGDGLLCSLFVLLQFLSCIYYGMFLGTTMAVLGLLTLAVRRFRLGVPALAGLVVGAVILGFTVAEYSKPYRLVSERVGERGEDETLRYSATPASFVSTRPDNRLYGWTGEWTEEEGRLFPGITPVVLAGAALVPPVSATTLIYAGVLAFTTESAMGMNAHVYPVLREWVPPFRGLRAPARFGALVQLSLGVLAAFGVAALARRWPRASVALSVVSLALVTIEYSPRPLSLMAMITEPPPFYKWLGRQPPGTVTLELPVPQRFALPRADQFYMYFSTWHWQPLVNGYSGHYYAPYLELLDVLGRFPSTEADAALEGAGVQVVTVHRAFVPLGRYDPLITQIDADPKFRLAYVAQDGLSEARAYFFLPTIMKKSDRR